MTRAGDDNDGVISDEDVEVLPTPRPASRSVPPPIPRPGVVRPGPTLTPDAPQPSFDVPTDLRAQASELIAQLATTPDPAVAATLALEAGEIFGRLGDRVEARAQYRRAIQLDPTIGGWALRRDLYRDRDWGELAALVDSELALGADPDRLREAAFVAGLRPDVREWQQRLVTLLEHAPEDLNARFDRERIARVQRDSSGLVEQWLALATLVSPVERRIGYLLAIVHERGGGPGELARAAALAADHPVLRAHVARVRVAYAVVPVELAAALAALVEVLPDGPERVAVQLRHTRLVRTESPARAWHLAPAGFPRAERLELAAALEAEGLALLVREWQSGEAPAVVAEQIARWAADSYGEASRPYLRTLLATLQRSSPGLVHFTSVVEVEALAMGPRARAWLDLAGAYEAAATAIERGDWLGPAMPHLEVEAAVALYIQAAYLHAVFVRTESSLVRADHAVRRALELAPTSAAVREVAIDVAEVAGKIEDAIALVRAQVPAEDRGTIERALRIATTYARDELALVLQRVLLAARPEDLGLAWRLESDLRFTSHHDEHAALLVRLVASDADPLHRGDALVPAARLAARKGDFATAVQLYRELRTGARDLDSIILQRADREAAAIHELALDQPTEALAIYREWHLRSPTDLAALTGMARTAERIGEVAHAAEARAKLVALTPTSEAAWLLARSLVAGGDDVGAVRAYRELATVDEPIIARTAALALLEHALVTRERRALGDALERVAAQTLDPQLGALLFERAGWLELSEHGEAERAARAFAGALERDPAHPGAVWGQLLAASRSGDRAAVGRAFAELATQLASEQGAAALWLRAAQIAAAEGNAHLARERRLAALAIAPDDVAVLVTIADGEPPIMDAADPFAENDAMRVHAQLLVERISLADAAATSDWRLEAALAFELADQPKEACAVLAEMLDEDPLEWRALTAVRRIARHAKHDPTLAAASFVLANASRDRTNRLELLRGAAEVYDRIGIASSEPFALATYRQIVELDPSVAERARYLELVRKSGDLAGLVRALTEDLAWSTTTSSDEHLDDRVVERAEALVKLGLTEAAIADLDAVLEHAPKVGAALHLRAGLALELGELDRAIVLWWRYLALDDAPARVAVEALLAEHSGRADSLAEDTHDAFDPEVTRSDVLATEIALETEPPPPRAPARKTASIIRRPNIETEPVPTVDIAETTARIDLSTLIEQEQREARNDEDYELEITGSAIARAVGSGRPAPRHAREMPAEGSINSAIEAAQAPPSVLRIPELRLEQLPPIVVSPPPILDARALELRPAFGMWPDDSEVVMVSYNELQPGAVATSSAALIEEIEREIAARSEPARVARLHCEAARLAVQLGSFDRARTHLEAAIVLDPRSQLAMRGLRRLAAHTGDLAEVVTWIDAELPIAATAERDGLVRYRIDVLLALGEHDLSRISIGERLDVEPSESESLVAQLVLAFLDDRLDELRTTLDALRSSVSPILAVGAERVGRLLGLARTSEDGVGSEVQLVRLEEALTRGDRTSAGTALFELACHVEGDDPELAAALALRAQSHAPSIAAAQVAARAAPRDPLVARVAAETAQRVVDAREASGYFARWARIAAGSDRAYAAAMAATGDPARFARLWASALEVDPDDDYARHQLHAIDPGAAPAVATETDRLIASAAWSDLAAALPSHPKTIRELQFRARVLDRAARANAGVEHRGAALAAWIAVLEHDPLDGVAQGAALALAHQLGPATELAIVERVHASESDRWAASSVLLQHAFTAGRFASPAIRELARDVGLDDPRRTLVAMLGAARQGDLRAAAVVLAERAALIDEMPEPGLEPATLRMRAAVLALESKDLAYAKELIEACEPIAPIVAEIQATLAERSGALRPDVATSVPSTIYAAASATTRGDHAAAVRLYKRAFDREPDPLTLEMLVEAARTMREAEPIAECAQQLIAHPSTRARGHELMAEAEQLRGDASAERGALELASEQAPLRFDLALRYLGKLSGADGFAELKFREAELARLRAADGAPRDLAAASLELAALALRTHVAPALLERLVRSAHLDDPDSTLAAILYDSVLTSSKSYAAQRATFEDRVARTARDPRMQATFWVRAGRTYAELGEPAEALERFADAIAAVPGYRAAVDARLALALAHRMWREVAEASTARAEIASDPAAAAAAYQLAGEVYETQVEDRVAAIASFQRVLATVPAHRAAYLHLRTLLEHARRPRELEAVLVHRIAHEPEAGVRLELQRTLAEMLYDAGELEAAAARYREVVRLDPTDPRAHAALVELAGHHENLEQAATAVQARLAIERSPRVLGTLHHRLGTLYASTDPVRARSAFESALDAVPDRVASLHALAELEVAAGAWPAALARCEQIANLELDPEQLARNFYRAASCAQQLRAEPKRIKQLIAAAIDAAPASGAGMRMLVELTGGDRGALEEPLDRIATAMRARIEAQPDDGVAYQTLSRALARRREELVTGAPPAARAAAELAIIFGAGEQQEHALLARPPALDLSGLAGLNADEHLFSGTRQPEVRQIFALLADAIARHIGIDPALQALGRKERLVAKDPVFQIAREVAQALGMSALTVYVSTRPHGMFAEPTSPVTLVLGRSVADGDVREVRFAAGAALKLVQLGLAIPARLDATELALLAVAAIRMADASFIIAGVSEERVGSVAAALRRGISSTVLEEVAVLARGVKTFDAQQLALDLRIVGLRAGFAAAGSVLPGLAILAAASGGGTSGVAREPMGRGLIRYALT